MTAKKAKTKRKCWSLFLWQVEETESWLAAMAAQGWHLSHSNDLFAVFVHGEPRAVRYRCDCFSYRKNELNERAVLYEAAGWEYVCSRRNVVHIFRMPAEASGPEIHTDPLEFVQSARVLERLLGRCQGGMGAAGAVLIFRFFQAPHLNLISVLLTNSVLAWLLIPCWLFGIFFTLWHLVRSILAGTRVRKGALLGNKPFRPARLVNITFRIVIIIFLLALPLEILSAESVPGFWPLLTGEDPKVVRIADLMPEKELEALRTSYRSNSSVLVPQQWNFTDRSRVTDEQWPGGAGYEPTLRIDGYKARNEWLAKMLGSVLARERASKNNGNMTAGQILKGVEVGNSPLESLWYFPDWLNQEFIAVQGQFVFHVKYDGVETVADLIEIVRAKIDVLEQTAEEGK